jgi:hypothetical protein
MRESTNPMKNVIIATKENSSAGAEHGLVTQFSSRHRTQASARM